MKSICFLIHGTSPRPVGGVKVIYQYANMLFQKNYDVSILFGECKSCKENFFQYWKNFIKFLIKKILRYDKKSWFPLDKHIKTKYVLSYSKRDIEKYDILVATMLSTSFHLSEMKKWVKSCAQCLYFVQDFEAWNVSKSYVLDSYRQPLKKIAISPWLTKIIKSVDNDVVYIPNGFDFDYFMLTNSIESRNRYEIAMLYHVDSRKRCSDTFKALNIVKQKYPKLHVNMFGAYNVPSDLPDWYTFVKMPNKEIHNSIYNNSAIFVNASAQEGWGLTVGEAMICGCAVVCSNNDGHLIMAKDNENSLVFEIGNIQQMVEFIEKLIADDLLRIKLAKAGNDYIQHFSWITSLNKFIDVIEGNIDND